MAVNPIPDPIHDQYQPAIPYLIVSNATAAIAFYEQAFGAVEVMRLADPTGKVAHAEITIGAARIMLADEFPEMGCQSPQSLGGTPISLMLYSENVDAQFSQAIAAGASAVRPVENQFYGDRSGTLSDPFGHSWVIATHVEDVAPDELQRRFSAYATA